MKDRMERSGMRWTQTHAQAMLNVRAIRQSSSWDAFHPQRITTQTHSSQPYAALLNLLTPLAG